MTGDFASNPVAPSNDGAPLALRAGGDSGFNIDIVLLNVDFALVARLLGATALGFYSLGLQAAMIPFYVVTMVVIGAGWRKAMSAPTGRRHPTDVHVPDRCPRHSTGVLFFAGVTIVAAPWLVLLSPEWESAVTVTRLLAVFVVLRSASYLLQAYFQSVGQTGMNAVLRAIWVVLLVCLMATIGRRGVIAVAGIQVVVAAVLLVMHVIVSRRIGGAPAGAFLADVFRPVLASVVAASMVVILQVALPDSWSAATSWAALIGAGAAFVVFYCASLRVIAPAVFDDLRRFRRWFPSRSRGGMREPANA